RRSSVVSGLWSVVCAWHFPIFTVDHTISQEMLKEIIIAIQSYLQAHRFIVKHRLWKWILIPGIIYTLLFLAGFYFYWVSVNSLIEFVTLKSGVKSWLDKMQDSWLCYLFLVGQFFILLV